MIYSSFPDTAVFVVNGHTVASEIRWEAGNGILPLTGEKLRDVMRRVDSAQFFVNGEEANCSFTPDL